MSSPASRALANSAQPSHQCPSRSVRFYARRLETTLVPQLRANASSAAWLNRNVGKIPRSSHLLRFRLSLCSEYLLRWAALQRYQLSPKGSFGPGVPCRSARMVTRPAAPPHDRIEPFADSRAARGIARGLHMQQMAATHSRRSNFPPAPRHDRSTGSKKLFRA